MLVEMVWRMMRWQPDYHALRKWTPVLQNPRSSAAARKKAVVAVARQLAVDLWRLFTGTPPKKWTRNAWSGWF
jgi:DNA-binding transcriptional regulator PaaX